MDKDNKACREQKTAQEAARMKRQPQESQTRGQEEILAPAFHMVPNLFEQLNADQRQLVIQEISKNSERQSQESLSALRKILRRHDPLLVLSLTSYYGLTTSVDKVTGVTKQESDFTIFPYHIEILQALCLQIKADDLSHEPLVPEGLDQVFDHVKNLCEAHNFRQFKNNVMFPQLLMRGATQFVRNWGYSSQVKRIARELYCPLDAKLLKARGFSVSDVMDVFDTISREVNSRMTARQRTLSNLFRTSDNDRRLLVKNYYLLIGLGEREVDQFVQTFNVKNLPWDTIRAIIVFHYDLRLPDLYTFSPSDLAQSLGLTEDRVIAILDEYALGWGALSEDDTEHFHLDNPVWGKPLIKLDDRKYFCALSFGFFSFVIPCIESLLSPFRDAVSNRRAEYLETKVAEIVKIRFPDSRIKRNFKWADGDTIYETDLIVFVDSFALVIECKSGKVTPPALRGAPDRLRKRIQKLLIDPNIQSLRLKRRLEFLIANPSETDLIRDEIDYDLNKVHKVVRASVCLENFGSIQSCLQQLKKEDTHWLPADFEPCPTMDLADFETTFDILEHPVQILHYLIKREMTEATFPYLADELDLLGWYLTTLFDIDDSEDGVPIISVLTGMPSDLDNYYNSADAGVSLNKPRPAISPLFASILSQLEQREIPRWTEIGVGLNMFSPDDQMRITKMLMKLEKKVHQNWEVKGHENTLIYIPSKGSSYALGYVMFKNGNAKEKRNFMQAAANFALQSNHVKTVIVIARNIDEEDNLAYHAIYLFERLNDTPE